MSKYVLTLEEQLDHLISDRNLIVKNRQEALRTLERVGYYVLLSGYKEPFKNPTTNKYRNGTTFEDIVTLYKFDENLREVFLKYILKTEIHMRSLISYYFTQKFGEEQEHYLNPESYTRNPELHEQVKRLVDLLDSYTKKEDYPRIASARMERGNVPLWVLVNALGFGTLAKMYSLLTDDLKCKIAKHFNKVNERQLGQYLNVLTKFRNVCAHNEQLYSFKTCSDIPDTSLHEALGISKKGEQYICGKRDLFSVVIALRYMLADEDFAKFKASLERIIMHCVNGLNSLSRHELYSYMGFPDNWEKTGSIKK